EMPALSGAALGFLGMAGALGGSLDAEPHAVPGRRASGLSSGSPPTDRRGPAFPTAPLALSALAGAAAFLAATIVLAFPYLSVREASLASAIGQADPRKALADLDAAARLNPLTAEPGRIGGTIALVTGRYT